MPDRPQHHVSRRRLLLGGGSLAIGLTTELAVDGRASASAATAPAAGPRRGTGEIVVPTIVTRKEWGADESLRHKVVYGYAPVRKFVIHHSAGPSYNGESAVRRTYKYHTSGRGMGDIAYNFLVGPKGEVFEGRWARRYPSGVAHDGLDRRGRGVVGSHSLHTNAGSCGICVLGDFNAHHPTEAALHSLIQLLAWKAAEHQVDPLGEDEYVDLTGSRRAFANIVPHRGVRATSCPGTNLTRLMPWIRKRVAKRVGTFPARTSDMRRLAVIFHDERRTSTPGDDSAEG